MKIKVLLLAALVSAATLSARAGVHFSFGFSVPAPVPVIVTPPVPCVVAPPAPVVYAPPAPVVYAPPVVVAPPVVTVAAACPGPGYVWTPGYYSGRVWVAGCWKPGPVHYVSGHYYGNYHGYNGYYNGWRR
ncbi:MAG TPA: hypothetical protein VMH87_09185 [Pseudomonadales bacterium]|nr:hypothetical protein [Pseudomonadales bacterium]